MKRIDFLNTQTAFARHDKTSIYRALFLFKLLSYPSLVKISGKLIQFCLKIGLPVSWIVKKTVYRQFVGGQTIDECAEVVQALYKYQVYSILDFSVEGGDSEDQMKSAFEETVRSIQNASKKKEIPFAVFKPSAFAHSALLDSFVPGKTLDDKWNSYVDSFRNYVRRLSKEAADAGVPLLIDAEDSWYQPMVDEITEEMMLLHNSSSAIIFNTLQMYRHDRLNYLKSLIEKAKEKGFVAGVKFVRGAYMEKERERAEALNYSSPIQKDKQATDEDFNRALRYCIEHRDYLVVFCGTHNEESCLLLAELMKLHEISPDDNRFWFSQLYGMSDHISLNLAAAGYNVAKYIPYGPVKYVMPYLMRRAEENTSVAGQTGRELSLIEAEVKRRKALKSRA